MKLTGASTRFRASGAGAYFTEVTFTYEGEEVDMGVANDDGAGRFVDPSGRKANITATGLVEATSNMNFIDVCKPGKVIDVTDFTGVNQADLDRHAPYQCLRASLSAAKRRANEDSMELISTNGAVPENFDPDTYGPPALNGAG